MTGKSIFCTAASRHQTDRILYRLKDSGFSPADISVLFPDMSFARELSAGDDAGYRQSATAGALGWLAGIGALSIPGAGPFMVAGPLLVALSGDALGGVTGALGRFGITEDQARCYQEQLRDGAVLISVHTDDAGELIAAQETFEDLGAELIVTTDASTSPEESLESAAAYTAAGHSPQPVR